MFENSRVTCPSQPGSNGVTFTIIPHLAYVDLPKQITITLSGILKYSTVLAKAKELGGITQIFDFFDSKGQAYRLVLYACTSGYPVPFDDVCLLEISRLRKLYADKVSAIGFSGHHHGIAVDIAAYTLGAEWFERHFTLDRTWKGTDQVFSLEPTGMRKLARDLRATKRSLTYKKNDILDIEKPNGGYEKYRT